MANTDLPFKGLPFLPPELRIKIYQMVFDEATLFIDNGNLILGQCKGPGEILRTCHFLYFEALPVLYHTVKLIYRCDSPGGLGPIEMPLNFKWRRLIGSLTLRQTSRGNWMRMNMTTLLGYSALRTFEIQELQFIISSPNLEDVLDLSRTDSPIDRRLIEHAAERFQAAMTGSTSQFPCAIKSRALAIIIGSQVRNFDVLLRVRYSLTDSALNLYIMQVLISWNSQKVLEKQVQVFPALVAPGTFEIGLLGLQA